MVTVRWTKQALDDIDHIAEFIAQDSIKYAAIQTERFFNVTELLKQQIRKGKVVPEIQKDDIRELIQGNYRIIYRIVLESRVDIISVHHSRRLLSNNPSLKREFGDE